MYVYNEFANIRFNMWWTSLNYYENLNLKLIKVNIVNEKKLSSWIKGLKKKL